ITRSARCQLGTRPAAVGPDVQLILKPRLRVRLLVARPVQLDPPALVCRRGVVMGEVDESALIVPDVLAVHDHVITEGHRGPLPDGYVVVDEHRLRCSSESNDETLVHTGRTALISQDARDHTLRRDLDERSAFGVVALYRSVVRRRGCARDD